jgi:hypothetical protein
MRSVPALALLAWSMTVSCRAFTAPDAATVKLDERAIYSTVLRSWLGSTHGPQLVNKHRVAAPSPNDPQFAECVRGVAFNDNDRQASEDGVLDANILQDTNITLVDGETWRATDPEQGMAHGQSARSAVDAAFARSLITFSQITFSANHDDALVSFGIVCGRLCGTGFTLQMHKSHGEWTVARRCAEFIS